MAPKKSQENAIEVALASQSKAVEQMARNVENITNDLSVITAKDSEIGERLTNLKEIVLACTGAVADISRGNQEMKTAIDVASKSVTLIQEQINKPHPF